MLPDRTNLLNIAQQTVLQCVGASIVVFLVCVDVVDHTNGGIRNGINAPIRGEHITRRHAVTHTNGCSSGKVVGNPAIVVAFTR